MLWSGRGQTCDQNVMQMWCKCDQNVIKMWSKCDQNVINTWSKRDQNVMKMWWKCDENVMKMWSKCDQNVMKMWWRCRQDVVKMSSRCRQDVVKMSSRCRQDVVKMSSRCRQDVISIASACDQHVINMWSACDQHVQSLDLQLSVFLVVALISSIHRCDLLNSSLQAPEDRTLSAHFPRCQRPPNFRRSTRWPSVLIYFFVRSEGYLVLPEILDGSGQQSKWAESVRCFHGSLWKWRKFPSRFSSESPETRAPHHSLRVFIKKNA